MDIVLLGIDLSKNVGSVVGLGAAGEVLVRRQALVEQSLAWVSHNRRLARDFERYARFVATFIVYPSRNDPHHAPSTSAASCADVSAVRDRRPPECTLLQPLPQHQG